MCSILLYSQRYCWIFVSQFTIRFNVVEDVVYFLFTLYILAFVMYNYYVVSFDGHSQRNLLIDGISATPGII